MIKAAIFDIYGTLLKTETGDLDESMEHKDILIGSFSEIKKRYNLDIDAKELYYLFKDNIQKEHKKKQKKGIQYPEIKIEDIWEKILKKINYNYDKAFLFKIAYEHEELKGKRTLYKDAEHVLKTLKEKGIKLGIISNAQFYTIIEMNNLLKQPFEHYFEKDLAFLSYKLGFSKPDIKAFETLKKRLKKYDIKEDEIMYIGNDMLKDIGTAKKAGITTCLFESPEVRLRNLKIQPNYRIKSLKELLDLIGKNI